MVCQKKRSRFNTSYGIERPEFKKIIGELLVIMKKILMPHSQNQLNY